MRKEVKQFIRELQGRGWFFVRDGGSGHIVMRYKPGGQTVLPRTPSDHRWLENSWRDVKRVEAKYGPYKMPEKKGNGEVRGLDYVAPEVSPMKGVVRPEEYVKVEVPKTDVSKKFVVSDRSRINPIQTKEDNFMSGLDKDIIIQTLEVRFKELQEKLGEDQLVLFREYVRIEKALADLGRSKIPDEEKIVEFAARVGVFEGQKLAVKKLDGTVIKEKPRIKSEEFYAAVVELVTGNNGKMSLTDIVEWLGEMKGWEFGGQRQGEHIKSPSSDLSERIQLYNKNNPAQIKVVLGPQGGRGFKYEYVKLKGEE
jgi:predicted RNA binding protein YcfA (HicA-like mRNA interferase family)